MIDCVNRSVLVVDGDPEFRALAARLLAASGLTVVGEADSISAALSAADRLKPSGVLVDAELPNGDGITSPANSPRCRGARGSFSPPSTRTSRPATTRDAPAPTRS